LTFTFKPGESSDEPVDVWLARRDSPGNSATTVVSLKPTARVEDGTAVYTAVGSNYQFNQMKKASTNKQE